MMSNLNYENKMRLKFNQYAYSTAYKRLNRAIEDNNDHEIYSAIGEMLLWVMNTHQWHIEHGETDYKDRSLNDERGVLLYGLAHAYNSMKHNMSFFTIHNKTGFSFENFSLIELDLRPVVIRWINSKNVLNDARYKKQQENYIKYIEGKEVVDTFESVLLFLNNENQKFYF